MSSSELNNFILNTDRVVRLGQIVLDVRALNTSVVGGKSAYDANDLTYNATTSTYDGTITNFVTANSSFNGLNATATTTCNVIASAASAFNGLNSESNSKVTHFVIGNSTNTFNSSAESNVSNVVFANASLGGLFASAITEPTILPIFNAILGKLVSDANATVIKPEPPEPVRPYGYGAFKRYEKTETIKPEPLPEPIKVKVTKTKPALPVKVPSNITALADPIKIDAEIKAKSIIEWSILDDEAELLLLL